MSGIFDQSAYERERQIEALMGQPIQLGWDGQIVRGTLSRLAAQRLIDHLNKAVPTNRKDVAQQLRSEAHGRIQTIRGMCTDEEAHPAIDLALSALDGLIYDLTERLSPSFSGEEGTEG